MSEIMSAERIAELVEAARHGQLPEEGASAPHRRGPRLRAVDFSRPTKFSSEHQRRIARAVETFCQTAVTRLSAELRWPVELEVINTAQLTWSAAHGQLPPNMLSMTLEVQPIGTRLLLAAEQAFVLICIECLLGGAPDRPPKDRRLTEIDWMLSRRLLGSLAQQLSLVWQDLAAVTLEPGELEHNDASSLAAVSEPTLLLVIECRIAHHSSSLALLIPWASVAPVVAQITGERGDGAAADAPSGIEAALGTVPVTLRAEVAATELAVAEVLALRSGSVIRFGSLASDGISLFAENVRLARAQPGANGARRAVQVRGVDGSGLR